MKVQVCILSLIMLAPWNVANAQSSKHIVRIGYLTTASAATEKPRFDAFRLGLSALGYVDGQNVIVEIRHTDGQFDRLTDFVTELIGLNIDVLVAVSTNSSLAAKKVTKTIPILFMGVADPVSSGLVTSLAHPGGNITGLTIIASQLSGKRLEILKETVPKILRVSVLWDPKAPGSVPQWNESERASKELSLELHSAEVSTPERLDDVMKQAKGRSEALAVTLSPLAVSNQKLILDLIGKYRIPAIHPRVDFVVNGGLMSYGPNFANEGRDAARMVSKIIKGTRPAEIPVEQPTSFELAFNLKTAKQIGLTIPPHVLARADRVIR